MCSELLLVREPANQMFYKHYTDLDSLIFKDKTYFFFIQRQFPQFSFKIETSWRLELRLERLIKHPFSPLALNLLP